jgi:predicted flap endonuclease-1-like 5' DNA nuclease
MPEISILHILATAIALIAGLVVGWVFRDRRSSGEKAAIHAGWRNQLEAQRSEHQRLVEQNKSLMEQNSDCQASNKDAKMRATELSAALKEAFERRDELQRQIKDIRSNLEVAVAQRDQLQTDIASRTGENDASAAALAQRDAIIAKLTRELNRARNEEARQLEEQLTAAQERIAALDAMIGSDQTRVEPVDREALGEDLRASNEPMEAANVRPRSDDIGEQPAELVADNEDHAGGEGEAVDAYEDLVDPADFAELVDDAAFAEDEPLQNGGRSPVEGPDGDARDNLKEIKGVGPAIEKTLNEMGICRFDQIAEMSEYEINRIASKLRGFRSRIYREDWIGQARDLHDRKLASQH